jgi:hypothetical protein
MYFAGEYSKFNEGEQVYYKAPDSTLYEPSTIVNIGILGSKLSEHTFLYEIVLSHSGKTVKVTEGALSKDAGGNHNKTLHLTLQHKWFDLIKSGKKREEYRELKPHWFRKFCYHEYLEGDELSLLCQYLRGGYSEYPVDLNYINLGLTGTRIDSNGIPINDLSSVFKFGLNICEYQTVVFHRGYTKETLEFKIDSITIGKGNSDLGAPNENVFIIKFSDSNDL